MSGGEHLGSGRYIFGLAELEDRKFPVDIIAYQSHLDLVENGKTVVSIPYPNLRQVKAGWASKEGASRAVAEAVLFFTANAFGSIGHDGLGLYYEDVALAREVTIFIEMRKRKAEKIALKIRAYRDRFVRRMNQA